ncbi:MAG: thiamine pyrophosphate-binding protein [Deltaproteobacteria bacterium]
MKVSDYIAAFLSAQNIHFVYEVAGGMITHLLDALYRQGEIRLISCHHEQAAAFAADAMARLTGRPGIAMATSGPGATNLLTGIGTCYFDSSPAIFITGQVNTYEQKGSKPLRQQGFQETDIVSIARSITKASWRVEAPGQVPGLLEKAYRLSLSGRPGPVLIDIPMDVQRSEMDCPMPAKLSAPAMKSPDKKLMNELFQDLSQARRPLILAGGGIQAARAGQQFRDFVEKINIPVVHSLMAVDALPYAHPLRVGMIGTYGNRWANKSISMSDFLLVVGSRLDIRQTGADVEAFRAGKVIYHVDCDEGEINNRVTGCRSVLTHLKPFLALAAEMSAQYRMPDSGVWLNDIGKLRQSWPDVAELKGLSGINPNEFMHALSRASNAASAFVLDIGQHQMWGAQSLEINSGQRLLTSGGMASMGFALPASIGASLSSPDRPVVLIAGDGGFQFNIQELETIVHNKLPVKIVVINNECYGMVRQFQESYFEKRYQSTYWGYSAPDFTKIARAYGIESLTVSKTEDLSSALEQMWRDAGQPFLLQVMIDPLVNTYPKIAFGLPLTEMEPFAKPIEMEGT